MWGVDGAFVLPTRQYDTPLALVAVLRTQLLRSVHRSRDEVHHEGRPESGSICETHEGRAREGRAVSMCEH